VRDHLKELARKGYLKLPQQRSRRLLLVDRVVPAAQVRLIGRVAAGTPTVAEQESGPLLSVPSEWLGRGEHFALHVTGDSMIEAGILDGDYVVAQVRCEAEDGDIVVVTLDGESTLKRFRRSGTRVLLVPENRNYQPIEVGTDTAVVQGVIVALLRRGYRERPGPCRREAITVSEM
jgi:repressor LexA